MHIDVVESCCVDAATRRDLQELWRRAFGDRFTDDDADHAYGGVHAVAREEVSCNGPAAPLTT